ncbi:transglutaminase domain-containing protein [Anabaena sp. FACHB-1237]|uniref:transglutaminase-like domain-containing protein n=1 Tax=Anabaena sp. FACHB-1237 TaxID=2692769 RepID=UPI0016801404|nr:transglutaminase-like domain-containing protein [Anabaena sp. FACHB-1237]MBD2139413.1 transglutaminase domain-containing protein [Anabaena sp. FACHB-1237]
MKTPPFLLGIAVLFWGWQTGLWILAIPMAIILVASRWVNYRWDFSETDFLKVANLSFVILLCLFIYLYNSNRSFYLIYTLLQWLPIAVFPLITVQVYSVNGGINVKTMFLLFDDAKTGETTNRYHINVTYPYIFVCIIGASNANTEDIGFYLGMFIITAIALSSVRSKRYSLIIWLCFMLTAGGVGFLGQMALNQLHQQLEDQVVSWLSNNLGQGIDVSTKQTSIGELGKLKLSNEIIFRVDYPQGKYPNLLLKEAAYNKYQSSIWVATKANFTPLKPEINKSSWLLENQQLSSLSNNSLMTIYSNLQQGKGVLRLPTGSYAIDNLPVTKLEKSQYGTFKVEAKLNDIAYQVKFNNNLSLESPPTKEDLEISKKELPAIEKIVSELDIKGKSSQEILKTTKQFFATKFNYSLKLTGKQQELTPLATFLLETRAGHCEYFASATTLILRKLGIPARYAVGYSVHEFSNLEKKYIVRSRNAHAWTLVYIDNKWQALDTTPPSWITIENSNFSPLSFIGDYWSFITFTISEWLKILVNSQAFKYGWWLIFPLLFLRVWLSGNKSNVKRLKIQQAGKNLIIDNIKIENHYFELIEKALNDLGFVRYPYESCKQWMLRLKQEMPVCDLIDDLETFIELYYRDRFDPQGINDDERDQLQSSLELWLKTYSRVK